MSARVRPALTLALAASLTVGIAAVASDATAQERYTPRRSSDREFDRRVRRADPGKVVATELAFARAAQEKGQWTAFAEFAADDAVMFVPEPVNAKEWLRRQQDPAEAVRWQPHQVWSSCDGTLAVTKGAWQRPDGSTGYFTTVWERQKNGEYKWVMDQGDKLDQPLEAPELIRSAVADCVSRPTLLVAAVGDRRAGTSRDGTLHWSVEANGKARLVRVNYWNGSEWAVAISERVVTE